MSILSALAGAAIGILALLFAGAIAMLRQRDRDSLEGDYYTDGTLMLRTIGNHKLPQPRRVILCCTCNEKLETIADEHVEYEDEDEDEG